MSAANTLVILREVAEERKRQDDKWGEQNHPSGTGQAFTRMANTARAKCDHAARLGTLTWRDILTEEFSEALAETNKAKLRAELIQTAAVAVAWVENLDRRAQSTTL